jgi:hypothetical protein
LNPFDPLSIFQGEAMTENPTLVVMAAGLGSRYGGLKQIDPVGPYGAVILDYSVYDALRAGFGKVVFVINRAIEEAFRERFGRTVEKYCETAYVFQGVEDLPAGFEVPQGRQKPWGTGHAVLGCKGVVTSPFAVINADDFYGRAAYQALVDFLQHAEDRDGVYDTCMVGYILRNTLTEHGHVSRGVCAVDEAGFLKEIHERTHIECTHTDSADARFTEDGTTWAEISGDSLVSMNVWGFTPALFAELETRFPRFLQKNRHNLLKAEFYLPNFVGELVQENKARVKVLSTDARWFGITYRQDKRRVESAIQALIAQGIYPEQLWRDGPAGTNRGTS